MPWRANALRCSTRERVVLQLELFWVWARGKNSGRPCVIFQRQVIRHQIVHHDRPSGKSQDRLCLLNEIMVSERRVPAIISCHAMPVFIGDSSREIIILKLDQRIVAGDCR
ncbi:hypothetical protein Dda3937_03746 [Dickeya dadantii 3937]|uniref:Uncharacterized protein n=1 Tax=Dickeya dadantii (strain 3937) TaxID=198628 RepID=E0SK89_DICD3|nr:hypothetical protein Dda3937_03746 [Dickeya dadantii 3937]